MRVHPFLAVAALLLVGVTALAARAVVQHREARARRPPPLEVEDFVPAPRHIFFNATPQAVRQAAPPAPEPGRGELHIHATGPHGLPVTDFEVYVHRHEDDPDDWTLLESPDTDDEDAPVGTFAAANLDPGRYDVRVEAEGMRNVRLDDVTTGPKVLEVSFARRPALLGAVGNLGGRGCAGANVSWSGPGDDAEAGMASVEDDCSFFVEALPEAGPVTIVAKRGRVEARALVTPPITGDAGFLCLAPPCGEEPASLLVYVGDTDHREVSNAALTWTLQSTGLEGATGGAEGMSTLWVHGRRAGQTIVARAERDGQAAETTTLLGTGVTEVLLTLPATPPAPATEEPATDVDDGPDEEAPSGVFVRERVIIVH
jgi:hypothetical protein